MRPRKFTSTRRLGVKMLSLDGKREIPWRACYSQAFCHVAPTFRGYKLKLLRKNRMIRKMFVPRTNQNQTSIQKSKCLSSFGPSWYPSTPHPQRRIPRFNVWLYLSTMKRLENSTKVFRWRWFAVFFSAIPSAAWLLISVVILILLFKTFAEGLFPLCLRSMIQTFFVRFRTTWRPGSAFLQDCSLG